MAVSIKGRSGDRLTLEVEFDLSGSMLDSEESIQVALNEAGTVATGEALKRFDTDGARIVIRWATVGLQGRGGENLPDAVWGSGRAAACLPALAGR